MPSDPTLTATPLSVRPKQAAKLLGLSTRTLWSLTNRNVIPHIRLGKCILYPVDLLRQWLIEQSKGVKL